MSGGVAGPRGRDPASDGQGADRALLEAPGSWAGTPLAGGGRNAAAPRRRRPHRGGPAAAAAAGPDRPRPTAPGETAPGPHCPRRNSDRRLRAPSSARRRPAPGRGRLPERARPGETVAGGETPSPNQGAPDGIGRLLGTSCGRRARRRALVASGRRVRARQLEVMARRRTSFSRPTSATRSGLEFPDGWDRAEAAVSDSWDQIRDANSASPREAMSKRAWRPARWTPRPPPAARRLRSVSRPGTRRATTPFKLRRPPGAPILESPANGLREGA